MAAAMEQDLLIDDETKKELKLDKMIELKYFYGSEIYDLQTTWNLSNMSPA